MEPIVISIDPPLLYGKDEIKELRIERGPTAADLKGVDLRELFLTDNILLVTERLTGVPAGILGQMDWDALDKLTTVIAGFCAPGRTTGRTG